METVSWEAKQLAQSEISAQITRTQVLGWAHHQALPTGDWEWEGRREGLGGEEGGAQGSPPGSSHRDWEWGGRREGLGGEEGGCSGWHVPAYCLRRGRAITSHSKPYEPQSPRATWPPGHGRHVSSVQGSAHHQPLLGTL